MDHELFFFFTTKPNDVVGAIHEKAMPVILRDRGRVERLAAGALERSQGFTTPVAQRRAAGDHEAALTYVPGLAEIPDSGDPLRLPMSPPAQPNLL